MIDLNEMAIFAGVVDAGSFTKAGENLGFPKSTISRKISMLEERLGVLLMQRTTRALQLTDAGKQYYQYCSRIVTEAREADLLAARNQAEPAGLIRISGPPGFTFLSDLVGDFLAEYDQIEVEVNFERRFVNLIQEGYDLAFRIGTLKDSSLIGRKLGSVRVLFCASPDYLEQYGKPEQLEDLRKHRLIQGIPWNLAADAHLLPFNFPKRVRTNDNELARRLTIKGFGVSILSEADCVEEIKKGKLAQVLGDYHLPEKNIYLLYPSNRHLSIKIGKFIEFALDRWKTNPPW